MLLMRQKTQSARVHCVRRHNHLVHRFALHRWVFLSVFKVDVILPQEISGNVNALPSHAHVAFADVTTGALRTFNRDIIRNKSAENQQATKNGKPQNNSKWKWTHAGLSASWMNELFRLPSRLSSDDEVDTLVVTFVVRLCVVVLTLRTLILSDFDLWLDY